MFTLSLPILMLLTSFGVALSNVSASSDIKWPQNTIFLKHKLKIKAEKLKCSNTEAIKSRISMNKEKSICLRSVTMSPSEDVSDQERFPSLDKARVAQHVWAVAAFLFILSHHDWFSLHVFHAVFPVLVGTVFTCRHLTEGSGKLTVSMACS